LPELGISWDIPRCPRVFLGLLEPGTSDCQCLGHPRISWDIPRCPRVFLGLLGPGTNDCQSLGHPGISQDVPGYSWDYLDLGQMIARAWDILGYPEMSQGIKGLVGYHKTLDGNPGQLCSYNNFQHHLLSTYSLINTLVPVPPAVHILTH